MDWKVHIYAEADSADPKCRERYTGYVLECRTSSGELRTKEKFCQRCGTYHAAILQTIIEAVERINQNCEIHIHTRDIYILNMMKKNLPAWAENEFRTVKGDAIANRSEWEKFWKSGSRHLVIADPGTHSYYGWMMSEMKKERKEHEGKTKV